MEIRVIGDRDTAMGFRLAGAFSYHVDSKDEALAALRTCINDPKVGVVIITNHWAHQIEDEINEFRRKRRMPLLTVIPSRYGSVEIASLAEEAKRVIGIATK